MMGVASWSRARRVARSLDRLGPSSRIDGRRAEPFPLDRDPAYFKALDKLRDAKGSLKSAIKAAPHETVSLADLRSPQGGVSAPLVIAKLSIVDESASLGVVARYRGQLWIVDGNHRMTAAKLAGKKTARVRVLALD